nr:MAG: protein m47 [Herpesviridae sp.]
MTKRWINLDTVIDELRSNSPHNENNVLGTLAKLEIASVYLHDITAPKIRQLMRYIPDHKTHHHLEFIHKHTVYYLLNHTTFGSTDDGRFFKVITFLDELQKYVDRTNVSATTVALNDNTLLNNVRTFVNEILSFKHLKRFTVLEHSTKTIADKRREFIPSVERSLINVKDVINCRIIAELIEELYSSVFIWFNNTFLYEFIRNERDGFLETLLKISYIYRYHTHIEDLNRTFSELATRHENEISQYFLTDLTEIQRIGSEYVRELSFALFTKSLLSEDHASLSFPLLSGKLYIWNVISVENSFFHPGLIYYILTYNEAEYVSTPADRRATVIETLRRFNDFCIALVDELFTPTPETAKIHKASLTDILNLTQRLFCLGLNATTTKTYIKMICSNTRHLDDKLTIHEDLSTAEDYIILILLNAHVFFTCLSHYNPTFIFHRRLKIILEQQRSILIGQKSHLETTWHNVVSNINRYFYVWYDETDFISATSDLTDLEKDDIYRDIINKWGDLLFTLTTNHVISFASVQSTTVKTDDLIEACVAAEKSRDYHSYQSLIPFSTHPEFTILFVRHFVIPEFSKTLKNDYLALREHNILLRLTSACRTLMARQTHLCRFLISFYTFNTYLSEPDIGVLKIVYKLTHDILAQLSNISGDNISVPAKFLDDLARRSFKHTLDTSIANTAETMFRSHQLVINGYLEHTRRCHAISCCQCILTFDPHRVHFTIKKQILLSMPMPSFVTSCKAIVEKDTEFDITFNVMQKELQRLLLRAKDVLNEITTLKDSPHIRFDIKHLTKVFKKIGTQISELDTLLSSTVNRCKNSNRAIVSGFQKVIDVVDVLRTSNLHLSIKNCVIDATGLVASSQTPNDSLPNAFDGNDRDIIDLLKDTFEQQNGPDRVTKTRIPMSATHDEDHISAYLDIFENRYAVSEDTSQIDNWYVSSKPQTESDIATPLYVGLITDTR